MNGLSQQQDTQEARIDRVLTGLRAASAPTGLEARIAERLRAVPDSSTHHFFPVILSGARSAESKDPRIVLGAATRFALLGTAFLALVAIALHLRRDRPESTPASPNATLSRPAPTSITIAPPPPQQLTLNKPHPSPNLTPTPADDPDAIALAETLAPSHPAPQQPLTTQERLLLRATRQGQPLEVAEFELAREPMLRAAAEAREQSNSARFTFAQVARSLLAPLAAAEALEPTPPPEPSSDARPTPLTGPQPLSAP